MKDPPRLRFYKPHVNAFIPIEFSAAAFRVGHATIRQRYKLNKTEMGGGPFRMFAEAPENELGRSQGIKPELVYRMEFVFSRYRLGNRG